MKYLFVNSVCGIGSTGRICTNQAQQLEAKGHECKIAYGRLETVPPQFQRYGVQIGSALDRNLHAVMTRLFDQHGFGSARATREFLRWAEEYDPDVLWLHNLHGYYIQVELLFDWIKRRPQMQVKWTLHDCWAFTGHCAHFSFVHCDQWKTGCRRCKELGRYPKCLGIGMVGSNYSRKCRAFCGVKNLTLIAPSRWLAGLVKQSFLGQYPIEVQYNSIDPMIFQPTQSDFRERHDLMRRMIVLGVSSTWEERKGLGDFFTLAETLDQRIQIVLVGLTKAQKKRLPRRILALDRTDDATQLAAIYTAADVFVNPTYEDNYPTVNLEAQACGTPVIAYDAGGTRETLTMAESRLVPVGAVTCLANEIHIFAENNGLLHPEHRPDAR